MWCADAATGVERAFEILCRQRRIRSHRALCARTQNDKKKVKTRTNIIKQSSDRHNIIICHLKVVQVERSPETDQTPLRSQRFCSLFFLHFFLSSQRSGFAATHSSVIYILIFRLVFSGCNRKSVDILIFDSFSNRNQS